ncbi:hypothetical protein WAI453_000519 [Rhynchosporium graminicola]
MPSKLPTAPLNRLSRCLRTYHLRPQSRFLSISARRLTDGVYGELTAMRTRTPFIEAFRKQQSGENPSLAVPTAIHERDLSPKSMEITRVILPLARDPWLLDRYINSSGHIRLGTIFMDLDALAGVIAYKHTGDSVMTVTAAVDRITLKHPLSEICDLELSGQVSFATGRSSSEISIKVAKVPKEGQERSEEDVLLTCAFTMVSLDPTTKKPVAISPLKLNTPEEKAMFAQGEANYARKKSASALTLRKQTPKIRPDPPNLPHPTRLPQPLHTNPQTNLRPLYAQHHHSIRTNHATAIPQPAQLHDLRRVPAKIHLRVSIHVRGIHVAHAAYIPLSRPLRLREPRSRRLGPLPHRHSSIFRFRVSGGWIAGQEESGRQ